MNMAFSLVPFAHFEGKQTDTNLAIPWENRK